jgi:LmbE family N-acetylglucosaminyl deacetylase
VFSDDASRRRVTEILRQVRPDLVLTSSPADYMCDHEATSALVRDACFAAPAPNYKTRAPDAAAPVAAIPHLYFMDAVGGVDRENHPILADFYVNVERVFARKRAMLAEHSSQRNWLRQHHGIDEYLEMMDRMSRTIGQRAGVEFAEGFRRYKGHPYPESPLLEELLGAAVVPGA